MSDLDYKLRCPFCNEGLLFWGATGSWRKCPKCDNNLLGNEELWQELIRTRKALDVANEKLRHCVNITEEELDELKGNLLIAWNALVHFSKDPIANNALKKITAPEQKDVK